MKRRRWIAIGILALAVTACTPSTQYGAMQSHKYIGSAVFTTREEWGTPVSKTRFLNGTIFYQFRKPNTDCMMSAWANDLDIIYRVAISGPETCAAGS
ncbi:hypothetical protein [Dongia sp. agr-C8]